MSKVIDERVVEMRFDNKDFESNVQTSLKTIDKLKDSLNFEESTKSVERFQDSLKHFSLDDIGQAVESLSDKFNWGNIFKMDLLNNVVDSVYSTITGVFDRIKGELHLEDIDPISNMIGGWNKYAEKTKSVATIMAATGESMEYVNEQMERLLYFTDETSYSFTDMAGNIGKFTSNGIALEDASSAMQGIATWAARSGQDAATASRVMYNLSQAIGMGALKLQDWKSVELANMGTKEFKEMAINIGLSNGMLEETDGIVKVVGKDVEVTANTFRESLKEGWLDSATLIDVLNEYGKAAELISDIHFEAEDLGELYAGAITRLAESSRDGTLKIEDIAEALELEGDISDETRAKLEKLRESIELLGSKEYEFSLETYKAGQEARTFGDAMLSVADAVSSGWMTTFELMFGGYETSKHLWYDLAENLIGIFGKAASERNKIFKEANTSGFDNFADALEKADLSMLDLEKSWLRLNENSPIRDLLEDGLSFEQAIKDGTISIQEIQEAIDALPGSFTRVKEISDGVIDNYEQMTEWSWELRKGMYDFVGHDDQVEKLMKAKDISKEYAEQVVTLSERHHELGRELTKEEAAEWLRYTEITKEIEESITLTDKQKEALRELAAELDKQSAQKSFIAGLQNIGHLALEVFEQAHDAIKGLFPPATADQLRKMAAGFERISSSVLKFVTDSEIVKNVVTALVFPFRVLYDVVAAAFKLIVPFGKVLIAAFSPLIWGLDQFGAWLISIRENDKVLNPFANTINKVAEALSTLFDYVAKVVSYVGGIVKDKLVEKFSEPFQKLLSIFNKFKEGSLSGLDKLIETIKNADIEAAGNKIINFLSRLWHLAEEVGKALSFLIEPFKNFSKYYKIIDQNARGLTDYEKVLKALKYTADTTFRDLEKGLKAIGIDIGPAKKALSDFGDGIATKFADIKNKITAIFYDIRNRFEGLGIASKDLNVLQRAFLALKGVIADEFPSLDRIIQKFRDLGKTIREFFHGTEDDANNGFFGSISEKLSSARTAVSNFFSGFKVETEDGKSTLQSFIDSLGITLPKVLKGAGIALAGGGLYKFIKTLKDAKSDKGGFIKDVITDLIPFSDTLEKLGNAVSSFNIVSFAIGIGLLAGALIAMSFVPTEKLVTSFGTLGASLAAFIGTIAAVNKVMGDRGTYRLVGMGLGMITIAASLLLFARALRSFEKIDISSNGKILKIFGGLFLAVSSMKRLAKAAGKSNFKLTGGLGLMATATSLFLFAKALEKFADLKIDETKNTKVLQRLLSAIVTLGLIAFAAGKSRFKLSNGLALIALAGSMLVFAKAIEKLGAIPESILKKGGNALLALSGVVTAMASLIGLATKDAKLLGGVGMFLELTAVTVAVIAFAGVAAALGYLDQNALIQGVMALVSIMGMVTLMVWGINQISKETGLRRSISVFIELTAIVLAVAAFGAICAVLGILSPVITLGLAMLGLILLEMAGVIKIINALISGGNMKEVIAGVLMFGLFGLALIPMVKALTDLGKLDFKKTQENMKLLGELFAAFAGLIALSTIVGGLASLAGPILLVGIGVVAGVFALFVGALTVLVKDLERLAAIDTDAAREGLECVREELDILTDLARRFQEEKGLFANSLAAAFVCIEFGRGLRKLADDTMILGMSNATQARESLKVVQEEIGLMTALGEQLAQNEGSFGKGLVASATAFNFGVGLHGLANDTRILGLVNAENAKAAMEPLAGLISLMISLAETIGTDVTLFGKAILVTADMVMFGLALLPLVGAEFVTGLLNAETVTSNMGQLISLIEMFFEVAEKVGSNAALYFSAKGTAEAIKDFGKALKPLISAEFLSQFVNAEASTNGFRATKQIVAWLISIAEYFQGDNSINKGAGAAVDRLNGFAKSLAKLTITDFFSQFVDADRALEGLKPVQSVVDMLVGMARDLSSSETMTTAAETAVESVKTFGQSLNDIMWSLSSSTWETIDTATIYEVINAIVDGLVKISAIGDSVTGIAPVLQSISDVFNTIMGLSSSGIFGKKKMDTSSIADAFAAIGDAVTGLATTVEQADIGTKITNSIIVPLTEGSGSVIEAIVSMGTAMSDTLLSFENSFYVDGNNLAVGFVNGIYSRVQDAYNAGFQLASDAEKGTRDAGEIKSPSRVFTRLGEYVGEGFVGGIESQYSQITIAAQGMIDRALSLASELKERLRAILAENDNEFHITPVLDMDDADELGNLSGSFTAVRSAGSYNLDTATVNASVKSRGYDTEIRALLDQVAKLGDHIDNMQMVLDTGVLVGATSAKMDSQFGIMTMRRGRGN